MCVAYLVKKEIAYREVRQEVLGSFPTSHPRKEEDETCQYFRIFLRRRPDCTTGRRGASMRAELGSGICVKFIG